MKKIVFLFLLLPFLISAQEAPAEEKINGPAGQFSLGMRSTISLFDHQSYQGLGYGGQFRIRAGKRLNTEWYADYIKTDIGGLGQRETVHIGWSVMFYPLGSEIKKGAFTPYFITGHCFDYANVSTINYINKEGVYDSDWEERWSSAVQIGLGTNYNLTDRFDVSLSAQYMSHLGNDIHVKKSSLSSSEGSPPLIIDSSSKGVNLEGHLLMTFSMNVMLFDFIQ
ncbi:MAG: hypothetical protein COA57_00555 [Flavobacteriales bacterium]|nr:MAG: hypothetical protein COA57_00555 [Flavobacteriales bacterium]